MNISIFVTERACIVQDCICAFSLGVCQSLRDYNGGRWIEVQLPLKMKCCILWGSLNKNDTCSTINPFGPSSRRIFYSCVPNISQLPVAYLATACVTGWGWEESNHELDMGNNIWTLCASFTSETIYQVSLKQVVLLLRKSYHLT